jgi:hypothetical protein
MCIDSSAIPLEPDAGAVERQYGEFADLYAETRARAAAKMGRKDHARKWAKVGSQIEEQDED